MCNLETELYAKTMSVASEVTGIPEEEILNSTTEESTDARALVVCVLSKYLTNVRIARLLNRSKCGIAYLLTRKYNDNWLYESNLRAISKTIENDFPK